MANEFARRLRQNMTSQEVKLWVHLRRLRKAGGWCFRRQAPFRAYILDFVCYDAKLVIELDGGQHSEAAHVEADRRRDALLEREGFAVLRFWNNEIDENLDAVWVSVMDVLPIAAERMQGGVQPHPSP